MFRRRRAPLYIRDEEELDLRGRKIKPAQAKQIAKELSTNTTLIYLNLGGNRIGDAGAVALARALTTNKTLKDLRLFRNGIDHLGLAWLGRSLVQNTSLAKLNVNSNHFSEDAIRSFGDYFKENKGLTELWLCDNYISDGYGMSSVWKALRTNTTLRNLYLQYNCLDDAGDLACAVRFNVTLTGLFLRGSFYGGNKSVIIADALKHATALRTLDLGRCCISDEGVAALAKAMRRNCGIISMWLDDNSIGDAGAMYVSTALHENSVLSKLFLNGNNIGPAGAVAVAGALRTNTGLELLGLGRNNIGNDGTVTIADALKWNTTLVRLDLYDNNISTEGAVAIRNTLEDNDTVMSLSMEANADISPFLMESINLVVASRQAFMFLLRHVNKPLKKGEIPLVVQVVNRLSIFRRNAPLTHCNKTAANTGFVFNLVRATALNESGVILLGSDARSHCWEALQTIFTELPACPVALRPPRQPQPYAEESRRRDRVISGRHHWRVIGQSYWPIADYYWYVHHYTSNSRKPSRAQMVLLLFFYSQIVQPDSERDFIDIYFGRR
jgi:Ran GTPase-activating protein (RanGAP) involved in mRNA processing and transport